MCMFDPLADSFFFFIRGARDIMLYCAVPVPSSVAVALGDVNIDTRFWSNVQLEARGHSDWQVIPVVSGHPGTG